jgi:hypothetical protein
MTALRTVLTIIGLAGLSACGGGSGPGPASVAPQTGVPSTAGPVTSTVSGRVTVKNGAPLAGVEVTAYQTNNHTSVTTLTDANGNYSFTGLMTGEQTRYEIRATKSGYGFYPAPANASATVVKSDDNALYRSVLSYASTPGSSVSGGNFDAFDGRNRLVNLPASGQKTSYAAGDDGALQKGAAAPGARYTDLQDGTVRDQLTGLVWMKSANCAGARNWNEALAAVKQMASGACGLSDGSKAGDWRLPNVVELESLVDVSRSSPALPAAHPFSGVSGPYWSSTTYRGMTTEAWVIDFKDGRYINDLVHNLKASSPNGVWAVKGGGSGGTVALQASGQFIVYADGDDGATHTGIGLTSPRFVDHGDGTLVDTVTGLVWLKRADCIRQSWSGALTTVAALAQGQCGLADGSTAGSWRMPNRAEMLSLADRAETNMALRFNTTFLKADKSVEQAAIFSNFIEFEFYWSSSTDAFDPSQAWTVFSCDYGVYNIAKANLGYTLAVRGPL